MTYVIEVYPIPETSINMLSSSDGLEETYTWKVVEVDSCFTFQGYVHNREKLTEGTASSYEQACQDAMKAFKEIKNKTVTDLIKDW